MDKLTDKKALLGRIRLSEGPGFECDEQTILEEYQLQGKNQSSRSMRLLSIFGGFLATVAFLGFFGLLGLFDYGYGSLILGIVFIIGAIWLNKQYDKLITDTSSVSIYVIGFGVFTFGLFKLQYDYEIIDDYEIIVTLTLIVALCSLSVVKNYVLSFISVMVISCSLITLMSINDAYYLIHLYITVNILLLTYGFLHEAKIISSGSRLSKLYDPVRAGLVISLLLGLVMFVVFFSRYYFWLSSVTMAFVVFYLVYRIIKITEIASLQTKIGLYALTGLLLGSTVLAPEIMGAIIIILLSFLVNYKTGLVIGIVALAYFVSQYYYDLNFTLFTKSIILFVSGLIFLTLYLLANKKSNNNEKS